MALQHARGNLRPHCKLILLWRQPRGRLKVGTAAFIGLTDLARPLQLLSVGYIQKPQEAEVV